MAQGNEGDLRDIRYYTNSSDIYFIDDNFPLEDLNFNVLTVDNKAILAKTLANSATAGLLAHRGSSGAGVHGEATETVAGFMSAEDKIKIDTISAEAQLNILSPLDALELVSRQDSMLHLHPEASTTIDGFLSTADRSKLDGIEFGANVNNISDVDAITLTGGPTQNANLLHTHVEPTFTETFDAGAHTAEDHTGLTGVTTFGGLSKSSYFMTSTISQTINIHVETFAFTPVSLHGGVRRISIGQIWPFFFGYPDYFAISGLEISGNDGIITYENSGNLGSISCWIGAYGTV